MPLPIQKVKYLGLLVDGIMDLRCSYCPCVLSIIVVMAIDKGIVKRKWFTHAN